MSNNIEEVVTRAIAEQVLTKLDVDNLTAKLLPQLEKKLPALLGNAILESDSFYDALQDVMYDPKIKKALTDKISKALLGAFNS